MRKVPVLLVVLALAVTSLVATSSPVGAEPQLTVPIRMVGDQPVSGRFKLAYTNYGEKHQACYGNPPQCRFIGYRVGRGSVQTRLRTYKIREGVKKYDYFLLDVDVVNVDRSGSSKLGEAGVSILTKNARPVEAYDSKSVSADDDGCHSLDVTMSTPWPYIQASADLGSVEFCHEDASLNRVSNGRFVADHLQMIRKFTISRAVKVPAGQRPKFKVRLLLPNDDCTKASEDWCKAFDNRSRTVTYTVNTTG
jgi:hypothetical protein